MIFIIFLFKPLSVRIMDLGLVFYILFPIRINCDTSSKIERQILVDEFDYPEFFNFAMVNFVMSF